MVGSKITQSPTLTIQATQAGLILGTAAYMSPEQARGRSADKRADIWSFGVVLFEMLSGGRLFEGEDVSETLAFVLTKTPDWTRLPISLPPAIVTLLKRCLERDRRRRISDMSTVRFVIDEAGSLVDVRSDAKPVDTQTPVKPLWRRLMPVAAAVGLTALVAGLTAWTLWPRPSPLVARFVVSLPQGQLMSSTSRRMIALSPDGSKLAYVANNQLYLRPISSLDASPLIERGQAPSSPVFSPDGQSIAFVSFTDNTVKRITLSGGVATIVCNAPGSGVLGTAWDSSGIIMGLGPNGVLRCPTDGRPPEQIVAASRTEYAGWPQLLPDGDTLIFAVIKPEGFNASVKSTDEATIVAHRSDRMHARRSSRVEARRDTWRRATYSTY